MVKLHILMPMFTLFIKTSILNNFVTLYIYQFAIKSPMVIYTQRYLMGAIKSSTFNSYLEAALIYFTVNHVSNT